MLFLGLRVNSIEHHSPLYYLKIDYYLYPLMCVKVVNMKKSVFKIDGRNGNGDGCRRKSKERREDIRYQDDRRSDDKGRREKDKKKAFNWSTQQH